MVNLACSFCKPKSSFKATVIEKNSKKVQLNVGILYITKYTLSHSRRAVIYLFFNFLAPLCANSIGAAERRRRLVACVYSKAQTTLYCKFRLVCCFSTTIESSISLLTYISNSTHHIGTIEQNISGILKITKMPTK